MHIDAERLRWRSPSSTRDGARGTSRSPRIANGERRRPFRALHPGGGPGLLRDVVEGAGFEIEAFLDDGEEWIDVEAARGASSRTRSGPMRVLVVEAEPGEMSADVGRSFARPGNRFWPAALEAGLVAAREDVPALRVDGVGMTNIVRRPTRRRGRAACRGVRRGVADSSGSFDSCARVSSASSGSPAIAPPSIAPRKTRMAVRRVRRGGFLRDAEHERAEHARKPADFVEHLPRRHAAELDRPLLERGASLNDFAEGVDTFTFEGCSDIVRNQSRHRRGPP
jgi:hypothetical protein